jgi:hypothetical protein
MPTQIYSDRGGSLVKAGKILMENTAKEEIRKWITGESVKWHYIPTAAHNLNGEAGAEVKIY